MVGKLPVFVEWRLIVQGCHIYAVRFSCVCVCVMHVSMSSDNVRTSMLTLHSVRAAFAERQAQSRLRTLKLQSGL